MNTRIKLAILADSAVQSAIMTNLQREQDIDIVGAVNQPHDIISFVERIIGNLDDLILLVDSTAFDSVHDIIAKMNEKDVPVVVMTDTAGNGFKLLQAGAANMVVRRTSEPDPDKFFCRTLAIHIRDTAHKTMIERKRSTMFRDEQRFNKIIAIGSSTGGTETVLTILKKMPIDAPPILVSQHMPPVFTKMYAERANSQCDISVWEARDGDRLASGLALIAPGDCHMTLAHKDDQYYVECKKGEKVHNQCPSVDVMFNSVAQVAQNDAIGVILTGMGADGAEGLLKMRMHGAYTIGQDEATSVVYGMPRVAYELGAVIKQLPLEQIAEHILERV